MSIFHSLSLFRDNAQNTNGFEYAFCKYIIERHLNLLLKCRVIRIEQQMDRIYDVTVQTNEWLTHLFAKRILDTTSSSIEKGNTVLFVCDSIDKVEDKLLTAFSGSKIEPAFYAGRYAFHIPVGDSDVNL